MLHIRSVLILISWLMLIICGFMLIPAGIALYTGETAAFRGFAFSVISVSFLCLAVIGIIKLSGYRNQVISTRDSYIFVTGAWLFASAAGSLPYIISGAVPDFADAFFETMSGFSTTGATVLSDIESLPVSLLFWRSMTQWTGGMGIVVLTVAIFPLLGIGGLQLIQAEAPGPSVDKMTPRIGENAKILWFIYLGFTVAETVLLLFGGMSLFDALCHSFSTVSTGGFSPLNGSLGAFNSPYIDTVVFIFMFLSGMNFALHYRILRGQSFALLKDTEFKAYCLIVLAASAFVSADLFFNVYHSAAESIRKGAFQVVSVLTTTGYATDDYGRWPFFSQAVILSLFFAGACSGSTSGGIKIIRLVTMFRQALIEMSQLLHPKGVFVLKISGSPVRKNIVYAIAGFFFMYMLLILFFTLITASCGEDLMTSFSAAFTTVGCFGPGFGEIGSGAYFGFLPDYVKWAHSFAMVIGRLELFTVLILFTPGFWRG